MQQIQRVENLRERARRAIRGGIISGQIVAGEIYSAQSLADQLGVSATPVREALIDLSNDGLVEAVRNRGFLVIPLSEEDLDELIELRLMLEVPSLDIIAPKITDSVRSELEGTIDAVAVAADAVDLAEFLAADRAFHLGLLGLTGNRHLVDLVGRLRDQTRLVGLGSLRNPQILVDAVGEHRAILDTLRAGKIEEAKQQLTAHIRHSRGIWAGKPEGKAGVARAEKR
jgi:DNA-binding GntR family transcriptional regulator